MKNLMLEYTIGSEYIEFPDGKTTDRKVWKDTDGNYWAKYKDHWYELGTSKYYNEFAHRDMTIFVCLDSDPLEDLVDVKVWTPYSFKS